MKKRRFSSQTRMIFWAIIMVLVFLLLHCLGYRDHMNFLSGTGSLAPGALARGTAYLISYMAAVVLAPIFTIAALLLWGFEALGKRRHNASRDCKPE